MNSVRASDGIAIEPTQVFAERLLSKLRERLEVAFRRDTAVFSIEGPTPSSGHCVAAALIVQNILGGDLASAIVSGMSHWFNRVRFGVEIFDVDLTADQFGGMPIRIAEVNQLYPGTRIRRWTDLRVETLLRAASLAQRARFAKTHARLQEQIRFKRGW
jgi:hypothetical protein